MAFPPIINRIRATITKHSMLSAGETVLIGLSGGPDSVTLLHALTTLRPHYHLDVHALYVDHGLRPGETDREIEFCGDVSRQHGIPFHSQSIDVKTRARTEKLNVHEAARLLRYAAYEETALRIGAQKIALGHTADDQAETVLMHLFRGSGPTGLAGIPPVRKNIVRPLIDIERAEIDAFLRSAGIGFITDSSNEKKNYVRNKIRLSLMPLLREFNPDITGTLSRTAAILRDEERYFGVLVAKTLMKLISRKTESRVELFLAPFEIMDKVLMRRVLRRVIDETKDLRRISFTHIEDMMDLIKDGAPGDRLYLPGGIRIIKDYSTLILTSEAPVALGRYDLVLPGETILKEAGILIKASEGEVEATDEIRRLPGLWKYVGVFDADAVRLPLAARPRKPGDAFYPLGFGRRKKIQDFFVDAKVPRDERDRIPLIVSGEDVVWIVGYRADERFKVTENTKRIIKLEIKKVKD